MKRLLLFAAWVAALASMSCADAQTLDVFRTRAEISPTPAAPLVGDLSCGSLPLTRPLEFDDVILQAICANPLARQAWANTRAQAAALGIADAAYLPTLSATTGVERETRSTTYDLAGSGSFDHAQNTLSKYAMLNLSWVLFDFGKRGAAQRRAHALLAAANATQDDTLQRVFFDAAQAFYGLRDAQAAVEAARETEHIAQQSLTEATARHNEGAGALSDKLQAQTTYRRALLDRVSAEGAERTATGVLASAMGFDANVPVPNLTVDPIPEHEDFAEGIDWLIDEAKTRQPKLLAARARLEAARANVDAARAEGRPTVSLTGSLSLNNPSHQQPEGFGAPSIRRSHGSTIGVEVTIPLFEGFASGYKIAQARAQADEQEAVVQETGLQVSLDVWKGYQGLQTETTNLTISRDLLTDAQRALDIARGRYKAGVGMYTELLNAQNALADARKERVLAVSRWHTARLRLGASLGKLGLWSPR